MKITIETYEDELGDDFLDRGEVEISKVEGWRLIRVGDIVVSPEDLMRVLTLFVKE